MAGRRYIDGNTELPWGYHGQDAHATARDDGVFLILLSATPRLCVTLFFLFFLPRHGGGFRPRLRRYLVQ